MTIKKTKHKQHLSQCPAHSRIFIFLNDLTDNKAKMCDNDSNFQRKGIYQKRTFQKSK